MNNTNTTDRKVAYVVHRETRTSTEFMVSPGRWSNEFPDAGHYSYQEARVLACKYRCEFHKADDYCNGNF